MFLQENEHVPVPLSLRARVCVCALWFVLLFAAVTITNSISNVGEQK